MIVDEERLWAAVLLQAFVDATTPMPPKPRNFEAWAAKRRTKKGAPDSDIALRAIWLGKLASQKTAVAILGARSSRARHWLIHDKSDFPWVCLAAGRDPKLVRDSAKRLEKAGWPEVKREDI